MCCFFLKIAPENQEFLPLIDVALSSCKLDIFLEGCPWMTQDSIREVVDLMQQILEMTHIV